MKKILIVNTDLDIGGGENSLVSFINNIDPERFDVTLGLLQPKLGMADRLDSRIKILKLWEKPKLGEYDTAIGYKQGKSANFVVSKVKAKKKISFFRHGSIKYTGIRRLIYAYYYRKTDCVITLTENLKNALSRHFFIPKEKIYVIEDIFDKNETVKKADEYKIERDTDYVFSTVARVVPVKNIGIIPVIAAHLINNGIDDFRWYIVGEWKDQKYYKAIKGMTDLLQLGRKIIFTGNKENPLPYIKASDLYIHLSLTESWCRSITDALMLKVPVLTTDTIGGTAQIKPGVNGEICDKEDLDDINGKLLSMIKNIDFIKKTQPDYSQDTKAIMEKYYSLF